MAAVPGASVVPSLPSATDISQCSAVAGQTFGPIVRSLLSALTKLDPDVAVAPDNPNLFGLDPFWRIHQHPALSTPALAVSAVFTALVSGKDVRCHQKP
jgi:hypothetical protein